MLSNLNNQSTNRLFRTICFSVYISLGSGLLITLSTFSATALAVNLNDTQSSSEPNTSTSTSTNDDNDFRGPIAIAADSAEQNEKKGVTIYRGNVSIEQGNLTINADTVTIESHLADPSGDTENSRSVTTIVANGHPARFTQRLANQSKPINASGNTIRYAIDTGIIQLEDNASIDKTGTKVTGEKIAYYIKEELVKAEADPNDKNARVHTIINPAANSLIDSSAPN